MSQSVLAQVRATLRQSGCLTAGQTVVVAVSGGADSLCLLHALWSLQQELEVRLHVAHLNHRLRGAAAAADAAFVARTAGELGLPATVEARDVAAYQRLHRLTLEEAAREERYRFLLAAAERTGAAAVATGHTADDNVETLVLHWLRGAGLAGMRGIPVVRELRGFGYALRTAAGQPQPASSPPVLLVRPLLAVTRAQTEAYCREQGLLFRTDETNEDAGLTRNRIRRQLLPVLETYNPGLRATLLRSAQAATDDFDFITGQVLAVRPQVMETSGSDVPLIVNRGAFRSLAPALQRGLLRQALEQLWGGWQDFGWVHLEALRLAVCQGRVGTVVDLPHGLILTVGYEQARLTFKPQAGALPFTDADRPLLSVNAADLPVPVPGTTLLPETSWRLEVEPAPLPADVPDLNREACWEAYVDASVVGAGLVLRRPRAGDRFQPLGMAGTKKLHDLFVDEKVPRDHRGQLPVLVSGERIAWVAGRWLADWARLRPETREAWRLRFRRAA